MGTRILFYGIQRRRWRKRYIRESRGRRSGVFLRNMLWLALCAELAWGCAWAAGHRRVFGQWLDRLVSVRQWEEEGERTGGQREILLDYGVRVRLDQGELSIYRREEIPID